MVDWTSWLRQPFQTFPACEVVMHLHCAWHQWILEGQSQLHYLFSAGSPWTLVTHQDGHIPWNTVLFSLLSSVCQPNSVKHDIRSSPALQECQMYLEIFCSSFLISAPLPVIFQTISVHWGSVWCDNSYEWCARGSSSQEVVSVGPKTCSQHTTCLCLFGRKHSSSLDLISRKGRYFGGHRSIFLLDSAPDTGSLLDPGSQCHI